MWRETGGSSHRSDASNLLCLRPLNHGLSCFCCVCAGQEGEVPEFRRHRLAGKQADCDVFSEVCGHFYVAAGRWAAKRRLAELTVGGAVLTNCISCHNHHHSPVEAATSPDLGSILAVSLRCSKRCRRHLHAFLSGPSSVHPTPIIPCLTGRVTEELEASER